MALRFSEEPTSRLSPKEAREFLRVHAEREARVAAADAPTVDDLAETLGLTPEEARSILQEARARTAPPKTKPRTASQQEARIATIILACALLAVGCFLIAAPDSARTVPTAPTTLPVQRAEAVSTPSIARATPPVAVAAPNESVAPIDHFSVQILANGVQSYTPAFSQARNEPLPVLGASEAQIVRADLRTRILNQVVNAHDSDPRWRTADRLTVRVGTPDGRQTSIEVPIAPGTLPLTTPEEMKRLDDRLDPLLAAAWPQIVH